MNRLGREEATGSIDWITILLYFGMALFGVLMIFAVHHHETSFFNFRAEQGKQLMWLGAGALVGIVVMLLDSKVFSLFAYPLFIGILPILLITAFIAPSVGGARSWFDFGFFKLQPAEFAKIFTALALAKYLSLPNVTLSNQKNRLIAVGIVAAPALMVVLQNDAGSAMVFMALFITLYRNGFPPAPILLILWFGILLILTLYFGAIPMGVALGSIALLTSVLLARKFKKNKLKIYITLGVAVISIAFSSIVVPQVFNHVLKPHHQKRILVLIGKETNQRVIKDIGYNVEQSKLAIGSGGVIGKGYLKGTMNKGEHVPKQSTDFIFSTVGEELGFIGSFGFIATFITLLMRIIFIAERQRSKFSQVYAYSVASLLFAHFVINVGMVIGLFPVVGIPLPFMSYGGSSMLSFTILVFILVKLDADRTSVFR